LVNRTIQPHGVPLGTQYYVRRLRP